MKFLDVSKYNKVLDWKAVKQNVAGVFIRCGYRGYGSGKIVEDAKFVEHANACQNNGIPWGPYFMSQAININEAIEEAKYTVTCADLYGATLPCFIDSEDGDGKPTLVRADRLNKDQRTEVVLAFLDKVEDLGRIGGTYASEDWFRSKLHYDKIKQDLIWVAKYGANTGKECSEILLPKFELHQYTSRGMLPGVYGNCDLSNGDLTNLLVHTDGTKPIQEPTTHVQINYQPGRSYTVQCSSLRVRLKPKLNNNEVVLSKQIGSKLKGQIITNRATMRLKDQIFMYIGLDNRGREQWLCADDSKCTYIS